MSIQLALADAAKNCRERKLGDPPVYCTITMRGSGTQFTGVLRSGTTNLGTHVLDRKDGGWVVFDPAEVCAVESHR